MSRRVYPVLMSSRAADELLEAVDYIVRDSPQNARDVAQAIREKITLLRRYPRSGQIDATAPPMQGQLEARRALASGFLIRYVFPFLRGDHEVVYVVSIRRASRPPLDDTDYVLRFLQEAVGIYA